MSEFIQATSHISVNFVTSNLYKKAKYFSMKEFTLAKNHIGVLIVLKDLLKRVKYSSMKNIVIQVCRF